jgi:hypothetical protein
MDPGQREFLLAKTILRKEKPIFIGVVATFLKMKRG